MNLKEEVKERAKNYALDYASQNPTLGIARQVYDNRNDLGGALISYLLNRHVVNPINNYMWSNGYSPPQSRPSNSELLKMLMDNGEAKPPARLDMSMPPQFGWMPSAEPPSGSLEMIKKMMQNGQN